MISVERRHLMEPFNELKGIAAFIGLSVLYISLAAGATPSANTQFSAIIAYEGACDIKTPATVIFNNGEAILPSQIEAGNEVAKEDFSLVLSNCHGVKVTPKITITGESNTNSGKALFLDEKTSKAKGYGVLLATIGNSNFKINTNLAELKAISVSDNWDANNSLTTINGTIPMTATLTCGDCKADGRLGGELVANVTFNFEYE